LNGHEGFDQAKKQLGLTRDQAPAQASKLLENLQATGLRVIVIDEDTDWSKMPSLAELLGER
jgi:hypothetical protein